MNYTDRTNDFNSLIGGQNAIRREDIIRAMQGYGMGNNQIIGGLAQASGEGAQQYMQGQLAGKRASEESAARAQQMGLAQSGEERAKSQEQRLAEEFGAHRALATKQYKPGMSVEEAQAIDPLRQAEESNNIARQRMGIEAQAANTQQQMAGMNLQQMKIANAASAIQGKAAAARNAQDVRNQQQVQHLQTQQSGSPYVLTSSGQANLAPAPSYGTQEMDQDLSSLGLTPQERAAAMGQVLKTDPQSALVRSAVEKDAGLTDWNQKYTQYDTAISELHRIADSYQKNTGSIFESAQTEGDIKKVAGLLRGVGSDTMANQLEKNVFSRLKDVAFGGETTADIPKLMKAYAGELQAEASNELEKGLQGVRPEMQGQAIQRLQKLKAGVLGGAGRPTFQINKPQGQIQQAAPNGGAVSHYRQFAQQQ